MEETRMRQCNARALKPYYGSIVSLQSTDAFPLLPQSDVPGLLRLTYARSAAFTRSRAGGSINERQR
eukprot:8718373-Pyramimonas_sp.AAC.2